MEYVNINLFIEFLKWGSFAIGCGIFLIVPVEFMLWGVVKIFRFIKLWGS